MASAVKWLLNQLSEVRELATSAKTAEKARVASIKAEAGKRFQKCYDHFCYMNTAVHTQKRRFQDHPELVVTIGEVAFMTGFADIAREVVQAYFDEKPQKDQFYCRAKILFGMIIDFEARHTNGLASIKERKDALVHIMESLDVATNTELNGARYNFLVFNSSLACWQILAPFLRATRASNFVTEMSRCSAALEKIDDADKSWRIKFLSAAALCYEDDKKVKESSDLLDKAIAIAETMLSGTVEVEKTINEEVKKSSAETEQIISAIRAVEDREEMLNKPPKIDPDLPEGEQEEKLPDLPPLDGLAAKGYDALKEQLNESSSVKSVAEEKMKKVNAVKAKEEDVICRLYMQRVNCNPGDAKKIQGLPLVMQSLRIKNLVTMQCIVCGAIPEKDVEPTFAAMTKELFEAPQSNMVVETILDLCRVAWKLKRDELAISCSDKAELTSAVSPGIRVKLDLCKAIRTVSDAIKLSANKEIGQRLSDKQVEGFNVSRRIEAMKLLERTLTMATNRLDDPSLVEDICVAIWNTGLTMLTPHLRSNVHTGFTLAADALANMSSALTSLRSSLHFEISKCEEQADFVVKAKEEGEKAKLADYGTLDASLASKDTGLDRNRGFDHLIKPFVEVLHLRANVYGSPEDVESQVLLNLQQIKESNSKSFQVDMLSKGAELMFSVLHTESGDEEDKSAESLTTAEIEECVSMSRTAGFAAFTEMTQRRTLIMANLAQIAHAQHNVRVLQRCAKYVLSFAWDPADKFMKHMIDRQIDMHFLLADSLVERLAGLWIDPEQEKALRLDEEALEDGDADIPNPRTLGITSKYCTEEMNECKRLVVLCLSKGVDLSSKIADEFGVQNGVIYFWNLHLASFRHELFKHITDDVYNFLKVCLTTIEALPQIPSSIGRPTQVDGRLKVSMINNLALLHEARNELPQGVEVANKGAADPAGSIYNRRKLCETGNRLAVTAGAAGAGGKGGKAPEPPKFDHPLLNVYALLAHVECPLDIVPKEQVVPVLDKAVELMKNEVGTWLETQDWEGMTQESYDEIMEMQAECWTRLTRVKIAVGDIHGSQDTAERCMKLVAEDSMKKADEKKLSPRVWRWMSVCERYFGMAIQQIIDPVGMDETLLNELALACLRHLCIACKYALRANMEDLLVSAAISAWNSSMHLVDVPVVRPTLLFLQREIIDALLTCKDTNEEALVLRQQFYLAMIEEQAQSRNYDEASDLVFEAFDRVPANLQKPLWKWRVVVLSKKGKNVLDAIQKLKEGDASLQARVYAILARASSNPKQQIEAYKKTMEILKENMERVDYTLETAQWMASAGVPRVEIIEVVQSGLDCLYEVEEKKLAALTGGGGAEGDADDRSINSSQSGTSSRKSAGKSVSSRGRTPTAGSKAGGSRAGLSRGGSRGRTGSKTSGTVVPEDDAAVPSELNIKHFEQGVRSLAMLGMLNSDELQRQDRCIEAVYFVKQFFALWDTSIKFAAKCDAYFKLTPVERDTTDFDSFVTPEENLEGIGLPVDDPVALLCWQPSEKFMNLMTVATEQTPKGIPSKASMQNLPLTLHYANWLAKALDKLGFPKYALLILGWVRAIFCVLTHAEKREAVFGMLHYQSISVMMKAGLSDLMGLLPSKLGNTDTDCFNFLSTFGTKLIDPAAVVKREVLASEELTVFGFSSWTQAFSDIDEGTCALEICQVLLTLGQASQCTSLASIIHRDFMVKQDKYSVLQTTAIVAELNLVAGRPSDVLTALLTARGDMMEAGDAKILAKHVELTIKAYVRSGQPDEAKRVAGDAMATLTEFANLSLSKDNVAQKVDGGASLSRSVSSAGNTSRMGTKGGTVTTKSIAQFESSLEVTESLAAVAFHYVDLLIAEATEISYNGDDPRAQFSAITQALTGVNDIAVAVCGNASSIVASILEVRSRASVTLLSKMHAYVALPGISGEEYTEWLKKNYLVAIQLLERSLDIRRGLLSRISLEQQSYLPSVLPKKVEEEVVDPKAKKGKKEVVEEVVEVPSTRLLSTPLNRTTAFAELQLAEQNMMYGRLCGDHLTVVPLESDTDPTVVEAYLKETTQPIPFKPTDFNVPPIIKGSHLASSAAQILDNTDFETFGALLHANSGVMRLCGGGAFDAAWRKPKPVFIEKTVPAEEEGGEEQKVMEEQEPEPIVFNDDAVEARSLLATQVPAAVVARRFGQALLGCATLVDAFGALGEGVAESVCWIFLMQSIMAREWLLQNWAGTLNPNGEIASSIRRLERLETSKHPTKESQPQIDVELKFLTSTSPSWGRLDITADPAAILAQVPASTAVLCLQMCPNQSGLYVCAGIPAASEGPCKAGGSWKVVKMDLPEQDRRLLLTLVKQQRKWRDDTSKFVAVYGENVSNDMDMVGFEPAFGSKIMKSERALEERLRALLSDMEQILAPIFGEGTEFREFLKSLSPADDSLLVQCLVDPGLQDLPWEGLDVFSLFGGQVNRDFSLHMLGHRLHNFEHRVCDASSLKTVFDPFGDDTGSKLEGYEREAIGDVVKHLVHEGAAGAAKWTCVNQGAGQLAAADWTSTIETPATDTKKISLFVYTPGRLGSLLSPVDVATMDFRKVLFVACTDQGLNDASFRRQNSLDNIKTLRDISLEAPLKLLANISLAGCGSIVTPSWATTLSSQRKSVMRFWSSFTKDKKGSVAALSNANGLGVLADDDQLKSTGLKPWIYLSRVSFGLSVTYNDAV